MPNDADTGVCGTAVVEFTELNASLATGPCKHIPTMFVLTVNSTGEKVGEQVCGVCQAEYLEMYRLFMTVLFCAFDGDAMNETVLADMDEFMEEMKYYLPTMCTQNSDGDYCLDIHESVNSSTLACGDVPDLLGCCAGSFHHITQCQGGNIIDGMDCEMSVWDNFCEGSPHTVCYGDREDESMSMTTSGVDLFSVISLVTVGLFATLN